MNRDEDAFSEAGHPQFAIGEIVTIHSKNREKLNGWRCFVDEIVTESEHHPWGGIYSLYVLGDKAPPLELHGDGSQPGDWYVGDWVGADLQTTGQFMTAEDLEKYRKEKHMVGGYSEDVDYVIANLKKTQKVSKRTGGMFGL